MFETRLHVIQPNDAIDKRKLWEGWLQWANRLSGIDSDNLARLQFGRDSFTIDAFLELFSAGLDASDAAGLVSNEAGTMVAASKKIVNLDISGDYWINWSLTLATNTGDCFFVGGVPFIGNQFIGSANDFKAEMGWFNNSDITESARNGPEIVGPEGDATELTYEDWESFGKIGHTFKTKALNLTKDDALQQRRHTFNDKAYIHLSGSGAATLGRGTGNTGIILFCQPGSTFNITASRLTLHRRNK